VKVIVLMSAVRSGGHLMSRQSVGTPENATALLETIEVQTANVATQRLLPVRQGVRLQRQASRVLSGHGVRRHWTVPVPSVRPNHSQSFTRPISQQRCHPLACLFISSAGREFEYFGRVEGVREPHWRVGGRCDVWLN
jgi:hypothetical protein